MNILAAGAWALDIAFFVILALGILVGVAKGFVKCVTKIAGLLLSLAFAVAFCVPFKNTLESWFGLQTALAGALGSDFAASWLSAMIAFVALIVLIRLAAWLLGSLGTALVEKFKPMAVINKVLGGLLGALFAGAVIFLLLALFYWIDAANINEFISESTVVGTIYRWEGFRYAARFSYL